MKLTFVDNSSESQFSCVNAKLSNGHTTQSSAVPWVTGFVTVGLAAAVGVLGVIGSANTSASGATGASTGNVGNAPNTMHAAATAPAGHPGPPAGNIDPVVLFLHFQSISSSGLLSLSYPMVYQGFTTNFAWANFIIPVHSIVRAVRHMRKCDINKNTNIPTVSSGGISTYSSQLGLSEQDIFGIIYLLFLCACALLLGLYLLAEATIHIASFLAKTEEKKAMWEARKSRFPYFASNNTLRLVC
jgi:hypothetical protein